MPRPRATSLYMPFPFPAVIASRHGNATGDIGNCVKHN
jgi:hypothetical protein